MSEDAQLLNLSDLGIKRGLLAHIGRLQGLYEIRIKPRKRARTLDQNGYYFVAVVKPFKEWLNEEWQENVTKEQAHELLKWKILGPTERQIDGQVIKIPPTTTTLTVQEFSEYVENCARWLADFGIVVIPSELFYEGTTEGK